MNSPQKMPKPVRKLRRLFRVSASRISRYVSVSNRIAICFDSPALRAPPQREGIWVVCRCLVFVLTPPPFGHPLKEGELGDFRYSLIILHYVFLIVIQCLNRADLRGLHRGGDAGEGARDDQQDGDAKGDT